ncbi:MAG TPA: hypothetical protein PKW11_17700, partial [Pseudomonadota bacterium]|nr:hypothetical protein [Pseudomonadota bacterium]
MSSATRPRPLVELLADRIPAAVLTRAQRYSEKSGRPLWFVLLREGLITEDQLFKLLESQLKLPELSDDQLDGVVVAPELKQAITARLAGHLGILPLERSTDGRRAALAMVDPTLDLTTLLPKLASHGVTEVRRFLIRFGTLRLGMDMFYNQSWDPGESAPAIEPIPTVETAPKTDSVPPPSRPEPSKARSDAAPSSPEAAAPAAEPAPAKTEQPASKPERPATGGSTPVIGKTDAVPLSKPEFPARPEISSSKTDIVPLSKPEFPARPEISSSKTDVV